MKKLYVSPDAEYLKIEFIEDVLTGSLVVDPDPIEESGPNLDLDGHSGDARSVLG